MSKQLTCQKFIYKIHSSRLRKEKWKLTLPIAEARKNDEVIALADSQMLRWIDELNGVTNADEKAHDIKAAIKKIRKEEYSPENRRKIRRLYTELDNLQFKPDYMCLIIDKDKDYYRACKGFSINNVTYTRLLGTNGGIKNSTIVFVSERLAPELKRRVENDRDPNKELVTAKLEAYKALTCSASNPVSYPKGLLIVDDVETTFKSDVIYISNSDGGEPLMEDKHDFEITMDASDGYGIMLPSLSKRWSRELELSYDVSGCCLRGSFTKGMVFTFDFLDFANKVGGTYIVKDAWGNDVDIRFVELILTTSMVKLWSSYESCDDYLAKSIANHYTFGVAKTCPASLESEHNLNYQFLQSFNLSDEDIDELIAPTMNEITDVLGGDWRKTILFLKGDGLTENGVKRLPNDFIKAIMINPHMLDDPYVKNAIYQMIRNRIAEAKVGVLKVHGNYSIVSGDPYLLCQHIFGLPLTGLLNAGEIYNRFWADQQSEKLLCFRAPMSCANNIRDVRPVRRKETDYWYRYMPTATIFNGWDTAAMALNGMDYDGDLVFLTDNEVMLKSYKPLPALMCEQHTAVKSIPSEEDFVKSNIDSFGNAIGQITNRITTMYDIQANYEPGSKEYDMLAYRIQAGQKYQQDEIDRSKGIISIPMPRSWYDRHAVNKIEDEEQRQLYRNIVADKKPYFMRYIYPNLMKEYNTYLKNSNRKSLRQFSMTLAEMCDIPEDERTEEQNLFIHFYELKMPVMTGNSVLNRVCKKFEKRFDTMTARLSIGKPFDYTILKSGTSYSERQFKAVQSLYTEYTARLSKYTALGKFDRSDRETMNHAISTLRNEFRKECDSICPNSKELCDIALDLCYRKANTKKFAWDICGNEIIENMLQKNNMMISYPKQDIDGDLYFNEKTFSVETIQLESEVDDIEL